MQGAVMEQADTIVQIPHFYGSLKGMQKKFDNYARQDAFTGSTREEWESWKETSRETLKELLGWKYMETCDLDPSSGIPLRISRYRWKIPCCSSALSAEPECPQNSICMKRERTDWHWRIS